MLKELVYQNRSYRAFDESRPITDAAMRALVDLARHVASGMNKQPLRYRIVSDAAEREKMLANTRYAGALGIKLPPAGQKPTGFIVIFNDTETNSPDFLSFKDCGIAAQTILLGATERGFGGCMLASFEPTRLCEDLNVPARYVPLLAIALGVPAEKVVLEDADEIAAPYYRDAQGVHHVPKRKLEDILL